MWSVSIFGVFLIISEKYGCFDLIFQESPGLCRYALICGVFCQGMQLLCSSAQENLWTRWWRVASGGCLNKILISGERNNALNGRGYGVLNHPQKQDEAQALQEKTGYDKPDNIDIINKSDSLLLECVYSLIWMSVDRWFVVDKVLSLRHISPLTAQTVCIKIQMKI